MLRLYDTARRRLVPFRPRVRSLTLYVCGITPYDTTHLGHARTFLVFDVLVRHLEASGLRVRYAQNVTDIDESILLRAARNGEDWRALGRREEGRFVRDMARLGWRPPDVMPHATREIEGMLQIVARLLATGHAYRLDGGVYYDVSAFRRYGELSRLPPARMRRILAQQDDTPLDDPRKRDPLDFALWRSVPHGPTWESPYGRGRPGWHLECSAMSQRYLGLPLDIHGGGADLVYPHHESELAQSEAASPKRFVRHWMHVAMMRLDGEKMSKSKGNMVFVSDALTRAHPDGLRLYLLSRHYRRPFDHDERLLARMDALAAAVRGVARSVGEVRAPSEAVRALDSDLDTPAAVRILARLARRGEASSAVALARRLGMTLQKS